MSVFEYSPLDETPTTIRLLRFHRTPDGSIAATLAHYPLDPSIRFKTLSYAWGTAGYTGQLILNSQPVSILSVLLPILSLIVDTPVLAESLWWIDSICINQSKDADATLERGGQVRHMGSIYTQSESTLCWLGNTFEGDEPKDTGIVAMKFLHLLFKNRWRLESPEQRAVVAELNDRDKWNALEKLLSRPWWKRVWTLQEYLLARKLDFYCGNEKISRNDLKVATFAAYLCRQIDKSLISEQAWQSVWNRRRMLMWYMTDHAMALLGLVAYGSGSDASDQRDRIYAVLGIASDARLIGTPDYKCDVGVVYEKLVKSFVEAYQSLDILCFTHLFYSDARSSELGPALPSWVPDWQVKTETFVIPVMASQSSRNHVGNLRPVDSITLAKHAAVYAAAGETLPEVDFSQAGKLIVKGIFLDTVDGIGGLNVVEHNWASEGKSQMKNHALQNSTSPPNTTRVPIHHATSPQANTHEIQKSTFPVNTNPVPIHPSTTSHFHNYPLQNSTSPINTTRDSSPNIHPATASKLLEDITRCLVLDRQDRYLSYAASPSYFYPYFKTICLAAIHSSEDEEISPRFQKWFDLNKDLLVRGYSLQDICQVADSHTCVDSSAATFDLKENDFLGRFKDTTGYMARRMVAMSEGGMGMGPARVQKGDRICVLLGCSIPLVLRKRNGSDSYEVIGEFYMHGFMNGEVLRDLDGAKYKIEKVELE